jgi:molybdopterin/thiamine biosynthesis adenylyltransferase
VKEPRQGVDDLRYNRNSALFGVRGQQLIQGARVTIIGLGGLGMPVAQELAYLGVRDYRLVDGDVVSMSSINRLVGATTSDVGIKKVAVARRLIMALQPQATVDAVDSWLEKSARNVIAGADVVFGCLDKDIHRVALIGRCVEAGVPFFDLATDTDDRGGFLRYGGRVLFSGYGERCPSCMDLLDQVAMRRDSLPAAALADHDRVYGISPDDLDKFGPAVVSLNGVIASLAVTEFMVWITGMRDPQALLTYRGERGIVTISRDLPSPGCPYCSVARGLAA